jgi:hypothetical protein
MYSGDAAQNYQTRIDELANIRQYNLDLLNTRIFENNNFLGWQYKAVNDITADGIIINVPGLINDVDYHHIDYNTTMLSKTNVGLFQNITTVATQEYCIVFGFRRYLSATSEYQLTIKNAINNVDITPISVTAYPSLYNYQIIVAIFAAVSENTYFCIENTEDDPIFISEITLCIP